MSNNNMVVQRNPAILHAHNDLAQKTEKHTVWIPFDMFLGETPPC